MKLDLANGWTLSVVPDLHRPYFSVAAWPTADPELARAEDRRWLVFESGGVECRIHNIAELMEIAEFVNKSEKPKGQP